MQQKTTATKTLDFLSAADAQTASCSNPSIPSIDWEYWKRENPDIVAWLTIPGTSINYPVAFAPRKQEDFYLSHDAFGEANLYGCLYIPNACENGIESQNICILGHNMSDGTMFAELLSYREAEFLSEHRTFYISTPCETTEYSILKVYFDKSPIAIELSEQKTVLLITCASTDNTPERLIISAQAEQRNNGSAE